MILTQDQIAHIITKNPNKALIERGVDLADKGMLHLMGRNMNSALRHNKYFVSDEQYNVQKENAISNKDMIARLLQQEDQVFTAHGGSSHFGLPDEKENQINTILSDVRYGIPLRSWVRTFALPAYRADPMGVIFMEVDTANVSQDGSVTTPSAYPTYKTIYSIYDYQSNGRYLEYICFQLNVADCRRFGISDPSFSSLSPDSKTQYYRIVDDAQDVIMHRHGDSVSVASSEQQNPIQNVWGETPAFIVSDIMKFDEPNIFLSPLEPVYEIAQSYMEGRSIRDLQKLYHGFAKAMEPLLKCPTCVGEGYLNGAPCPDCTPRGGSKGTGYKMKSKISDVAKFPVEILESGNFDIRKIFGYITPDIASWEKQDKSLDDLEELIEMTYWGTIRVRRPKVGSDTQKTATEVESNDSPKEARLNITADWVEKTENDIANFIGKYWFREEWRGSSISLGREYILKTPEQLMADYQERRSKGAPDFSLDEALEKYYRAKYKRDRIQLAKYLKMLDVEPFPHSSVKDIEVSQIVPFEDKLDKRYFGEWSDTVPNAKWVSPTFTAKKLKEELRAYVNAKNIIQVVQQPAQ